MRRRHQPHVDLGLLVAAHRLDALLLEHAQQLGLERIDEIADLVEEQRALVRLLEQSAPRRA